MDLLAQNIAPRNQKAARELLNLFSIGRRGDASAGYKYLNQMEGHQNRLERYFYKRLFPKFGNIKTNCYIIKKVLLCLEQKI
jgi:hypothetical protein